MSFIAKFKGVRKYKGFVPEEIYELNTRVERDIEKRQFIFFKKEDCICVYDKHLPTRLLYYRNIDEVLHDWEICQYDNKNTFKVITLCGSTKFKDTFLKVERELAKQNYIVINLGLFTKSEQINQDEILPTKEQHDMVHRQKINMCDGVFVINENNYIGNSTMKEVEYATKIGKKVFYLSDHSDVIISKEDWDK